MSDPVAAVHALYRALEAGVHGEALRAFFTDDATTTERPNLVKPRGGSNALEHMLAASTAGAGLLEKQTYLVGHVHTIGDEVIVRAVWTGVIGRDVGAFRRGQELRAHLAQFFLVRDGKIARIETYDCYDPLP